MTNLDNGFPATVGEWYETLPAWKKMLFGVLAVTVGDIRAIKWCGYWGVQVADEETVNVILERPDALRRILNGYDGPFAVGVGEKGTRPAIRLCVQSTTVKFPSYIDVSGIIVPIVVDSSWTAPEPLKSDDGTELEI